MRQEEKVGRENNRIACISIAQLTFASDVGTRQNLSLPSRRWAGRTPSRQLRQKHWRPPNLSQRPQRALSTYSEKEYVIGDSTPSALRRIANLLTNGSNPKEASKKEPTGANDDDSNIFALPSAPVEMDAQTSMARAVELPADPPCPGLSSQPGPGGIRPAWGQDNGEGERLQADDCVPIHWPRPSIGQSRSFVGQ